MKTRTLEDKQERMELFRRLAEERGKDHPFAKVFNQYADKLEAQIKQAKAEGLKSFDESKYKLKGVNNVLFNYVWLLSS